MGQPAQDRRPQDQNIASSERTSRFQEKSDCPPVRSVSPAREGPICFGEGLQRWNQVPCIVLVGLRNRKGLTMLVERNVKVMNVAVIGDGYAIASNYLRKSGQISDRPTNDRLLEIVVMLAHRGETNKIRLANTAITMFETEKSRSA
jgi:hypothetical protein